MRYAARGLRNPFGLYDVLGNAWQWTEDCWSKTYADAPSDASVAVTTGDCDYRVVRGGFWNSGPAVVRAGARSGDGAGFRFSYAGFRVARTQ
jgi:formylglycine-generating enzyme required for sulfatase activity